ncbi:MAG: hypothetical protein COA74_04780 [Gammaproteobacteria bacterium]|nr:MAG: hypothetical protein COA74_04780 [Gammaproteobacteria bacterium]
MSNDTLNDLTNDTSRSMPEIEINMKKLIKILFISCLTAQFLLIVFDYVFNYMDILDDRSFRRIWNIARENSIPTWFSSIQAQLLGVTVILIGVVQKPKVSLLKFMGWVLIGLFFILIGIDDFAAIHEKLGGVLERMAKDNSSEQGRVVSALLTNPSYSWHTFIAPFFALCGLVIALFLWKEFWHLNLFRYLVLGFGCWIVAQSLDFIEGLDDIEQFYRSVQDYFSIESYYLVTHTFKVVEEELEMLGTTILWVGFLKYFAFASDGLRVRLTEACG